MSETKEEAYHAADSHHSNNKWTGWERMDGSRAMITTVTAPLNNSRKNGQDFYVH